MKKRLLYILHCYYNVAGTEEHTRLLASCLKNEFEVWIAAPDKDRVVLLKDGEEKETFPVTPIPWPVAPYRSSSHEDALKKIIDKIKPDIIHVQHFIHWHLGLLPQLREVGVPVYITYHDYFAITPQFTMLGIADPRVTLGPNYSKYHFGSDISEYLRERRVILSEALSALNKITPSLYLSNLMQVIFPGQYKVIQHGIVPFEVKPKIESSTLRFGCIGSLLPQKGYHSLLEGFSMLRNEFPQATLTMFGDGEHADKQGRDGVTFAGRYSREDLTEIMTKFDIGIIPSIFAETFCLALSELWLANKPVAVSDIGALSERVSEGVNGKLFKPGDPQEICKSLKWFLQDNSWKDWNAPKVRLVDEMIDDYKRVYNET